MTVALKLYKCCKICISSQTFIVNFFLMNFSVSFFEHRSSGTSVCRGVPKQVSRHLGVIYTTSFTRRDAIRAWRVVRRGGVGSDAR